ncbi:ABC transporter substrate-binding protein [Pseudorhodoferax aquiterrae]|uniref:Thiamine pyrimidine synthase n=1 Tax=Pseudorhodoferax aquiterrae TaxID=747304 RepID=A0ABQ3G1A3_9BURK|nr:ABC transporter substrate-binding protein [Pseudorhodoferax aquiterrae]GHC82702.1 ABC transporter substrate-binding protein [Pseudorhodoferax aquiterrae]
MKTRHFLRTVAAAVALAALAPLAQAQTKEPVKASLRLKWLTQTQFAGFYYAQAKGYYKDEGIDLTINPGGPNLLTENLVATGADTFGLSGGSDSVMAGVDKGLPIVSIGVAHQITPFVFVTKADSPIKTLKDFEGKKVTTWFTGANYVLFGMLGQAGIDRTKVDIQPQQVSMTPFINGDTDVATATVYNEMWVVKDKLGDKIRTFRAEDSGITFPRDTLIVSKDTAQKNPELVKAFLRASIKGWREAAANPKEAVDIVMKVAPTLNRAQQESMLTEAYKLMTAGKGKTEGLFTIDPTALKSAHDFLLANKVLTKPVDVAVAFDDSFLKSLTAEQRKP